MFKYKYTDAEIYALGQEWFDDTEIDIAIIDKQDKQTDIIREEEGAWVKVYVFVPYPDEEESNAD